MTIKVLNLRGTNGSGKTFVARELLSYTKSTVYRIRDIHGESRGGRKPIIYKGSYAGLPYYTLGSYEANCGGCDTIPSVKIVADLLREFKTGYGILFYEGLMISHMIGTVGAAAKEYGRNHVMAFLDTPLDVCIERVKKRRLARGDERPFNPKNVEADWPRVRAARQNAINQGFNIVDIGYNDAFVETLHVLNEFVSEIRNS